MDGSLQLINVFLTGTVLVALLGAAVAYGRLQEKVNAHDKRHDGHEKRFERIEDHIGFGK